MELLNIFAMMGIMIDDLLAIISVIGSSILFIGSFSKAPLRRYGQIADWSILGLIFGTLCQLSMTITATTPDKIGFVVRMTPIMVNGLLALSFLLLIGRWWLRRNRSKTISISTQQNGAGQSTREMVAKRHKKRIGLAFGSVVIVLLIALVALNPKFLKAGSVAAIGMLLVAQVLMNYSDTLNRRMRKEEKRAIRGAKGEEKVGSILATLGEDYLILHDVVSNYGNIDHIVISKASGIFLIETKAHGGKVSVNNGHLLVNGHDPEKDFIAQTLNNTYWLKEKMNAITGVDAWITPVLVFTNAFVERTVPIKGVTIINKKYLLNLLQRANGKSQNQAIWESRERIMGKLCS